MRVIKAVPSTEVDHIIQPRIEAWLKDYDYVVVNPFMGLSQLHRPSTRAGEIYKVLGSGVWSEHYGQSLCCHWRGEGMRIWLGYWILRFRDWISRKR
jgi:hypothetical protein